MPETTFSIRCFFALSALLTTLLVAAVARPQGSRSETQPQSTFRVAGVVVSSSSGAPLAQTRVSLTSTKNRRNAAFITTQEDGRFEFTGVPAGKYSLEGARRGFIPAAYEQHEQYSTAIVTGAGLDTENLKLRLVPMAALTGSVIDETGQPLREAQLRLYRETHAGGTTRVQSASFANTDDQGTFEFAPLAPGKYFVAVSATPWYAMHVSSAQANGAAVDPSLNVAYPLTFYGGATTSDGAQPIPIAPGDRQQIEIRLSPVPALRFVFHRADNPSQPTPFPVLQRRIFDSIEPVPGQTITVQGLSEITGLAPGQYAVQIHDGSGRFSAHGDVDLKQDGQDLSASSGEALGHVKFSVKLPGNEPVPRRMSVAVQDETNRTVSGAMINANGEATLDGLAGGKYSVRVFGQGKAYAVAHMSSPDVQMSGPQFVLKPGESQEWTLSLATGKTAIEGFVKRGNQPASGIMVVLIPENPEAHQDLFRRDESDLDGSFVLPNVIPGLYTVAAVEDAWGFDWSQPLLLARYATHGQAVTIGELMQGAVTLADAVQVQPR